MDKGSKERGFTIGEHGLAQNVRGAPKCLDVTIKATLSPVNFSSEINSGSVTLNNASNTNQTSRSQRRYKRAKSRARQKFDSSSNTTAKPAPDQAQPASRFCYLNPIYTVGQNSKARMKIARVANSLVRQGFFIQTSSYPR